MKHYGRKKFNGTKIDWKQAAREFRWEAGEQAHHAREMTSSYIEYSNKYYELLHAYVQLNEHVKRLIK